MTANHIFTLACPDRFAGSWSERDIIPCSVAPPVRGPRPLVRLKEELASHYFSTSILFITPFHILSTSGDIFLWQLNHPTRRTPYIVPNYFKTTTRHANYRGQRPANAANFPNARASPTKTLAPSLSSKPPNLRVSWEIRTRYAKPCRDSISQIGPVPSHQSCLGSARAGQWPRIP